MEIKNAGGQVIYLWYNYITYPPAFLSKKFFSKFSAPPPQNRVHLIKKQVPAPRAKVPFLRFFNRHQKKLFYTKRCVSPINYYLSSAVLAKKFKSSRQSQKSSFLNRRSDRKVLYQKRCENPINVYLSNCDLSYLFNSSHQSQKG